MSDLRAGAMVRAARRRRGWRQVDLARAAGLSQQTVSLVERGHFDALGLRTLRKVAAAVGVDLPLAPRYRGSEGDRLLDARHAAIVAAVVDRLTEAGWEVCVEFAFNHYGDRGSVDVLAWHGAVRSLLIVEVKSELVDVQQTLRALSIKQRIVPALVAREREWRAARLGVVLVLPDERGRRASIERHAAIFDVALPARTVAVKRWVAEPEGELRGVWFLNATNAGGRTPSQRQPARIRRPRTPPEGQNDERGKRPIAGSERGPRARAAAADRRRSPPRRASAQHHPDW